MFYRDVTSKDARSKSADGKVTIDLTKSEERLSISRDGKLISFNSLDELLQTMPEELRYYYKRDIYTSTRKLFETIEFKYPDSTSGVISFLEGKAYQLPGINLKYVFNMDCKHDISLMRELEEDTDYDLSGFAKKNSLDKWPSKVEITAKNNGLTLISKYLFDPYKFLDLFFKNITDKTHSASFLKDNAKENTFSFSSSPKYDRLNITTGIGELSVEYDSFQIQILSSLYTFLKALTDKELNTANVYTAAFIVDYWTKKEDKLSEEQLKESSRLINKFFKSSNSIEKGFIPADSKTLIDIAIDNKLYHSKTPVSGVHNLPPRYLNYLEAK